MRASAHQQRQVGERAKAPVTDQDVPQLEVRVKELDMSHSLYTRWLQLGSQAERPRPSRSEFDLLPHALSPRPHELGSSPRRTSTHWGTSSSPGAARCSPTLNAAATPLTPPSGGSSPSCCRIILWSRSQPIFNENVGSRPRECGSFREMNPPASLSATELFSWPEDTPDRHGCRGRTRRCVGDRLPKRDHRWAIPSVHRRAEPQCRLIGSIPKTDIAGRSKHGGVAAVSQP
jgi:hypothetical protein